MADEQTSHAIKTNYRIVVAAGALPLDVPKIYLETSGAIAITLADGVQGQHMTIMMTVDGGTATLTPANFANGTTITFADVNDSVILEFDETVGWIAVTGTAGGVAIA